MKKIKVSLARRSYPIFVGRGAFASAISEFKKIKAQNRKVFCIADSAVLVAHPDKAKALAQTAEIIEIKGGESSKCAREFGRLCSLLAQLRADRKSAVAALGGGVVGDLAGFVSASYMRGVDFYQIPTTLLAMVDSSVGGKTGINIPEGKNLVGAFHQPKAVFTDTSFLDTLPPRQFAAGMAEVVKCAVLGDAKFFGKLESAKSGLKPDSKDLPAAIIRACELKAAIVAEDEFETSKDGGRALLNLGHTFGHAIENCAGYGKYMHGEAVGIGIAMAAALSRRLGKISLRDAERISAVLAKNDIPVRLSKKICAERLLDAMSRDKKAFSGELRFVLINSIGNAATEKVQASKVSAALEEFFGM